MLERLLTLNEISASMQVSISTLRRAIRARELPHTRVGRRGLVRVSPADLQLWLAGHRVGSVVGRAGNDNSSDNVAKTSVGPVFEGHVGDDIAYKFISADVRVALQSLPKASVNAIVTSPPYYWQRDYEVDGQIGHESSIREYVESLADVFDDAKAVLADDGLLFLNLGDAYYNAKGRPHGRDAKHGARQIARQRLRAVDGPGLGLPRKSLIGLPWRTALSLQERGWTLRSAVIWHRPGTLGEPTSHDRPWRTHEHVFIFSKKPKYYFDRSALGGEEDIWSIRSRPENPYAHCAPFPVELVDRCLACGCVPGGVVLDPFMGSGTTAISAIKSGRPVIGIDLNASYLRLAERRLLEAVKRPNFFDIATAR